METWKPLAGRFAGLPYEVSNYGAVRSCCSGWRNGRLLKPFPDKDGYLRVSIYSGSKKFYQVPVHILVAEAFICAKGESMTVNHKDTNKANNAAENLEWMTTQENTAHAKALGIYKRTFRAYLLKTGGRRGMVASKS